MEVLYNERIVILLNVKCSNITVISLRPLNTISIQCTHYTWHKQWIHIDIHIFHLVQDHL